MSFALADTLEGKHRERRGLSAEGWENGVLEVRVGNVPARALYSGLGFAEAGMRKSYYSDGEDALIMTLSPEDFRKALER
jgi:ribosomal-protein-alanine N-acetyltransferase